MSYTSREKKRQAAAADRAAMGNRTADTAYRWFLTLVRKKCSCARCSGVLRVGSEMVYRHTPRETLCKLCAESDPAIKPRPSMRWQREHRRHRPTRPRG